MTGTGLDATVVKNETKQFFDTQGKLVTPTDKSVEYLNCAVGQIFQNGTLTITKKTTGAYKVEYISTPADKLTINYIDQQAYEAQYTIAINNLDNRVGRSVDLPQNAFTMPQTITSVFTPTLEKSLSTFDDYEKTLYKDFMESIVDTNLDSFIDKNDYAKAFTILKTILESNANYANYPALKTLIDSNLSSTDKALIVDKFKTIFSYILVLTDGKIDGRDVATTANGRGEGYRTIKGPDDATSYPLPQSYKTKAVNAIKNESSLSRETVDNLVGFTAFYRLGGTARKFAITPIGGTNILAHGDKKAMVSIEKQDLAAAQEWFISNLNVNTTNRDILLNKINSSITSE